MAYYGRRRNYSWGRRYYRGFGRRNWYYSSRAKRSAYGNQRAANQQKDVSNVVLNVSHKCSCAYVNKTIGNENFNCGVYALNIWDLLRKSSFYQSYASMYDQVKINRIKVKLSPISWTYTGGANSQQAVTVVTAWDRSGLAAEQIKLVKTGLDITGEDAAVIGKANDTNGLYVTMNEDISSYSSAMTKNLNPNSSASINRFLYPSSIAEKGYYVNTSDMDPWYKEYDAANGRYYGIMLEGAVLGNPSLWADQTAEVVIGAVRQSPEISGNPCFLLEDSQVPFKPTLLIGVQSVRKESEIAGSNTTIVPPITFNLEADIACSFRGLRKAKMVE